MEGENQRGDSRDENLKEVIKDTQMLIRNTMLNHKKTAKRLHTNIKKDKKTIDLYKEKIAKLSSEKEKLELKVSNKLDLDKSEGNSIKSLTQQILKELEEKKQLDEKILEIKEDFCLIKGEMGGLNATRQVQDKYEKHIRILENRLDKANQKFNEAIEKDKILREEIDQLRKERFFFENIYKKLEKDLEKVRKEISINLESAYENYEVRDKNQEQFEIIRSNLMKKENEYAQILTNFVNDQNIKNSRKKSVEAKENMNKNIKIEEENILSYNNKKQKAEMLENQNENLLEKLQNLEYKFQKLEEFTEQKNVEEFCSKFKKNAQRNFDLFLTISMISKQSKQLEKEIKDIEAEIDEIKKFKRSQQGAEKNALLNELKSKTQKLIQNQDKFESEYKKKIDEFKAIKNNIYSLYISLSCEEITKTSNKLAMENGVNENNVLLFLSEIENRLKMIQKYFEINKEVQEEYEIKKYDFTNKEKTNPRLINEQMKLFFANLDISKLKTFEKIKNSHKAEEIKFENISLFSDYVLNELQENVKNQQLGKKNNKYNIKKK